MIDPQRQELALAAIHAAAAGVLGLLNGDPALRLGDQDRAGDDEDERKDQEDDLADADRMSRVSLGTEVALLSQELNGIRHAGDDAGENQEADAVAKAVLVDLLAEPHQEDAAGGERSQAHDPEADRIV